MSGLTLYLIIGLIALALDVLVSLEFRRIAAIKGWPSIKYFFYPFFFFLAGYIMVAALPDRGTMNNGSFDSGDLPEL